MKEIVISPNEKQQQFFLSTAKYTAYGGARGGGKSWAMRIKLVLLAINYDGIQILLLRRTLCELRENHLIPLLSLLRGVAVYHSAEKEFCFPNGSRIKLGYCDNESDVLQFQGQAYEVIGLEEATHFTEFQFLALTESNRASGCMSKRFLPRMYFTCNPGGVGHAWVKRLFVDRSYKSTENPNDYLFIKSLVFDNRFLMENNPEYIQALKNLPETRRRAMLFGDWDSFEGAFFPEFDREKHVADGEIPKGAVLFRALDYGLDMTCCLWCAAQGNRITVYRELYQSDLLLSDAARRIVSETGKNENIRYTVCSPDLFSRRQESGKSGFEIMSAAGLSHMIKADNRRVDGWRVVREYLKGGAAFGGEPFLEIRPCCTNLIRCLPLLMFDSKVREDCSGTPHEITHAPEALRYALMSRQPKPLPKEKNFYRSAYTFDSPARDSGEDFHDFLTF